MAPIHTLIQRMSSPRPSPPSNEFELEPSVMMVMKENGLKLQRIGMRVGTMKSSRAWFRKLAEQNNQPPPPEPPKQDYIHVRARRGQATDSHSLA
ncbi:hypothetical protein K1719_027620 [Acacia pycnantha]|nr:hypothetical protein K1719_027620 [Acacia pycnantha]